LTFILSRIVIFHLEFEINCDVAVTGKNLTQNNSTLTIHIFMWNSLTQMNPKVARASLAWSF